MDIRTLEQRFSDQWLFEMPMRMGASGYNPYDDLVAGMEVNASAGYPSQNLGDGLFRMMVSQQYAYYWVERDNKPEIIAGVVPFENGLAIGDVGKRPAGNVHASDFYQKIVSDTGTNLLFSGDQISDEGYKIWKRLLSGKNKLFGYDVRHPGKYSNIDSEDDLEQLIGDDHSFRNSRFVLSEDNKARVGSIWTSFEMKRIHDMVYA